MCKFCEGYDRKNSGKFAIYMTKWSDERGTTLSVDFDGFDESSDTDFEVNFCPMCGKQLKQVQESTELTEALETLNEFGFGVFKRKPKVDQRALWLDRAVRVQQQYNSLIEDYYPEEIDKTDLSNYTEEELREYIGLKESDIRRFKREIYKQ